MADAHPTTASAPVVAPKPAVETDSHAAGRADFVAQMKAAMGEPATKGEAPAAPATPALEQPKASDKPAEGRNTDPAESRYERARRAMLRSGWKDDEFRKLDKQEATRRGLKLERQLNRQATAFAATQSDASKKGQGSPQTAAASTSSNVQAPASDGLAELFKQLGVDGDSEAQELIQKHLSPVLSENARLKAELEQRDPAEGLDVNQAKRLGDVRAQLSESIAELSDNDEWQDVLVAMTRIGDLPRYADATSNDVTLAKLVRDAAALALDIDVGERDQPGEPQTGARHGVVDTNGSRPSHAGPVTPYDRERAAFAAQMRNLQRSYASGV